MKTSLDIHDELLARAKRHAKSTGLPLRALVEDGLRNTLSADTELRQYRLPDLSVGNPKDTLNNPAAQLNFLCVELQSTDLFRPSLEATRSGRGRAPAVPRGLRRRLLDEVIAPYEVRKSRTGTIDWNDIALRTADLPSRGYDIVIIDESQDLSANQMRAVLGML